MKAQQIHGYLCWLVMVSCLLPLVAGNSLAVSVRTISALMVNNEEERVEVNERIDSHASNAAGRRFNHKKNHLLARSHKAPADKYLSSCLGSHDSLLGSPVLANLLRQGSVNPPLRC